MGHYTTYALKADLRQTTPKYVIETLQWLLDLTERGEVWDYHTCPVPPVTDMDRFYMAGEDPGKASMRGSAWNFWHLHQVSHTEPELFTSLKKHENGWWEITARACVKDYEVIDRFLKWLSPYLAHHPEEIVGFWVPDAGSVWRAITPRGGRTSLCVIEGGGNIDPFHDTAHEQVWCTLTTGSVAKERHERLKEEGQYDW